jgi:hypothetical protein
MAVGSRRRGVRGNWNIRHNCRSETQVDVLAILRNQESAEEVFQTFGVRVLIAFVKADVISEHGIQKFIEQVKGGTLPSPAGPFCCIYSYLYLSLLTL